MSSINKAWVFLDERPGNNSQALGLAEAIGLPFETKQLKYNSLAGLPNFFNQYFNLGIDSSGITPPWPDIVISVGRKQAATALYIKKQNPKTYLIQIMWPAFPAHGFDLIILPEHDEKSGRNIIKTIGAMHHVTPEMLRQAQREIPSSKPKIAFMIGNAEPQEILKILQRIKNQIDPYFMISTSRRTPLYLIESIKDKYASDNWVHDWQSGRENPYLIFISSADYLVLPGDSVSMCSEGCGTGKPVYIFETSDMGKKHYKFIDKLFGMGAARPISSPIENYIPVTLNETSRVAALVKERLKSQAPC